MGEPERVVLEGVDRYHVTEALFEGVRVILSYRGEPHSPVYVQGVSGAAFRIGGICPCAPTCTAAMSTQDLLGLLGYEVEALPLDAEGIDLQAEGARVVSSIKDEIRAGRPALVWHAFTNAEWDAVAGYDDATRQFFGRGSYAGLDGYAVADQMRMVKAVEICPAYGAILVGGKVGALDARAAEMAALEEAVKHAHTRKAYPAPSGDWVFLEGLQCYDRWVDDLKADPTSAASMGSRYCYGVYRSTHRAAAGFLQELSAKYAEARAALLRAASDFAAEAAALDACAPYLSWEAPDTLDAGAAAEAHRLLGRARDAYARGIDGVGAALQDLGKEGGRHMNEQRPQAGEFVPYALVTPGFEATYTGGTDLNVADGSGPCFSYFSDAYGNVARRYSLWGFAKATEDTWDDEIRVINAMQAALGPLDDDTREIRAQIGSLVGCDNGVPVTIDEVLTAIGTGKFLTPAFHAGCWMGRGSRTTQPGQTESMRAIEAVIHGYLAGQAQEVLLEQHPHARGFVERAYTWLGPVGELKEVQRLMLQRMLLPFEYFAKHNPDHEKVLHACFDEGNLGKSLDAAIAALAGIPDIVPNYRKEYRERLETIAEPEKRAIYTVSCHIADCISELSDCHHAMLRRIERWIHGIGMLTWDIPSRAPHAEAARLGRLFFGYALGLDAWLRDSPMQFLLLDLGHVDLGFDPKNEILRVYANLGESTPVKRWLAACLWYKCVLEPPAGLYRGGFCHKELLRRADAAGVSIRDWMDQRLSLVKASMLGG